MQFTINFEYRSLFDPKGKVTEIHSEMTGQTVSQVWFEILLSNYHFKEIHYLNDLSRKQICL